MCATGHMKGADTDSEGAPGPGGPALRRLARQEERIKCGPGRKGRLRTGRLFSPRRTERWEEPGAGRACLGNSLVVTEVSQSRAIGNKWVNRLPRRRGPPSLRLGRKVLLFNPKIVHDQSG